MNENLMLDENETLAMLRAGRTGSEPPMTDLTLTVQRDGLRLRRRRQAGQAGAGALLAGAAALALVVATPGLTPDGRDDLSIADSAPDPGTLTETDAAAINLKVLAAALGPDFSVQRDGERGSDVVAPVPGSAADSALPAGYRAEAAVIVGADSRNQPCKADPDREGITTACETRTSTGGREVELQIRSGNLAPSTPVEIRRILLTQPDGDTVGVTLRVQPRAVPAGSERVPRDAINAWIAPYVDGLVEAATDERMAPGSIRDRAQEAGTAYVGATPHERNLTVLQAAFGPSFERADWVLRLNPGSVAAEGLPAGIDIAVTINGTRGDRTVECTLPVCTQLQTPGGGTAYRYVHAPKVDEPTWPQIMVLFPGPDGTRFSASIGAVELFTYERARADALVAWLQSFEDELIAAVTDPDLEIELTKE